MSKKITIIIILFIILGLGIYFASEKRNSAVTVKTSSTNQLTQEDLNKKHCSGGFAKWKDGKFVQVREGKCITEAEFGKNLKGNMEKINIDIAKKI